MIPNEHLSLTGISRLWMWVFSLFLAASSTSHAQYGGSHDELDNTWKFIMLGNSLTIVGWITEQDILRIANKDNYGNLPLLLREHIIIFAAKGDQSSHGRFLSEGQLRDSIKLVDAMGVRYKPLPDRSLAHDLKKLLSLLRPKLPHPWSQFSERLSPFVFLVRIDKGDGVANAERYRSFSIRIGSEKAEFDIPGSGVSNSRAGEDGGTPADDQVVDKAPVIRKQVSPHYPSSARKERLEGKVIVRVLVDKEGKPARVYVVQTDAAVFNASALEAARQFLFTPALSKGKATECWVLIPFRFQLSEEN